MDLLAAKEHAPDPPADDADGYSGPTNHAPRKSSAFRTHFTGGSSHEKTHKCCIVAHVFLRSD
eukprot:7785913-Pyramimonas_sp.AAC.1